MSEPKTIKVHSYNIPLADTGDYDGMTELQNENGKCFAWFDESWLVKNDCEETLPQKIADRYNSHDTLTQRLGEAEKLLKRAKDEADTTIRVSDYFEPESEQLSKDIKIFLAEGQPKTDVEK